MRKDGARIREQALLKSTGSPVSHGIDRRSGTRSGHSRGWVGTNQAVRVVPNLVDTITGMNLSEFRQRLGSDV